MPRHRRRDPIFRYCRHEDDLVVLCVRWYISYRLSLRDLTEMMAERGLSIYPSTIWRWVQRFVPEFEKRWDYLRRQTGSSWRVDETYVRIRGKWFYLYRAVDKQGRTIDFLLRPDRGIAAAHERSPSTDTFRAAGRSGCYGARPCFGATLRFAPTVT